MRAGRILAALGLLGAVAYGLLAPAPTAEAPGGVARELAESSPPIQATQPPLSVREARLAVREARAINRILATRAFVSRGGGARREIALTFDDGPSPYTEGLLGELRRLHVPATFFQVGYAITGFPGYAARERSFGFAIGDHTLSHPFLAGMPLAAQRHEILGAAGMITGYGAPYPSLVRPPYESFDATTARVARAARMLIVLWSVDTADYTRPGVGRIVATAVSGARPGAIILLHDGGGPRSQTVAAVPTIVRDLRRRHYRFVTVGRLMLDDPPPAAPPRPPARPAPPAARPPATHRPRPTGGSSVSSRHAPDKRRNPPLPHVRRPAGGAPRPPGRPLLQPPRRRLLGGPKG